MDCKKKEMELEKKIQKIKNEKKEKRSKTLFK